MVNVGASVELKKSLCSISLLLRQLHTGSGTTRKREWEEGKKIVTLRARNVPKAKKNKSQPS